MRRFLPLTLLLALLLSACGVVATPTPYAPHDSEGVPADDTHSVLPSNRTVRAVPPPGDLASAGGVPAGASARVQAFAGVPNGWEVLVQDDFGNDEVWQVDEFENGGVEISDSDIEISADQGWMTSSIPTVAEELSDGYISATFTVDSTGSAGVMARTTSGEFLESMYICWIEAPSSWFCYRFKDEYWSLMKSGETTAIKSGENTVGMQIVGGNIVFGVNGVTIASFTNWDLQSGGWGVFAQSGPEAGATARFTHVLIAAPGEGTPSTPAPQPTEIPASSGRVVGIDPTFGESGKLTMDFGSNGDQVNALLVQPDGKIVAGGEAWPNQSPRFVLTRMYPDGSIDEDFGDEGRIITTVTDQYDYSGIRALALQPDGKILAAGYSRDAESHQPAFGLVRYHPDGSLDLDFGKAGRVTTLIQQGSGQADDQANAMVLQPDGKIVLVGSTGVFPRDFAVARYNSDGSLDDDFGTNGRVVIDFGYTDTAFAVALQSDGKILIAGQGARSGVSIEDHNFALARLNKDGSLDRTFGERGTVIADIGGYEDKAQGMVVRPDGKIVLGGIGANGAMFCYGYVCWRYGMGIAQFNSDGSLDTSFGEEGKYLTPDIRAAGYGLARLSDGTLALAGFRGDTDFALALFTEDGLPVPGFGDGGILNSNFGTYQDHANAIALTPDGSIIAAGQASINPDDILDGDFALAKFR